MFVRRCHPETNSRLVRCEGAKRQCCPVRNCFSCPLIAQRLLLTVSGLTNGCGCMSHGAGGGSVRLSYLSPAVNGVFVLHNVEWQTAGLCTWMMSEDPNAQMPFEYTSISYPLDECSGEPAVANGKVGWVVTLSRTGTGGVYTWWWHVLLGLGTEWAPFFRGVYSWNGGHEPSAMECNKIYRTWTDSRPCGYRPDPYSRWTTGGRVKIEAL